MKRRSIGKLAGGAAAFVAIASFGLALTPSAHAEDFFSALFGGFRGRPAPEIRMPFQTDDTPRYDPPRQRASYGGGTAYCVRGCDGRYFPAQGNDSESKAQSCKSFCPASVRVPAETSPQKLTLTAAFDTGPLAGRLAATTAVTVP